MIRWLACLGLGSALAGCGCATPTASTDAATALSDSGPFCAALLPQLMAGGWDECSTYCPTGLACDAAFRCDLPPYGCNTRWAYCYAGQVVVSTDGIVCDAGRPSVDAGADAP